MENEPKFKVGDVIKAYYYKKGNTRDYVEGTFEVISEKKAKVLTAIIGRPHERQFLDTAYAREKEIGTTKSIGQLQCPVLIEAME